MTVPLSTASTPDAVAAPYDFRRPLTLPRAHARVLEDAVADVGRRWATGLTSRLRLPVRAVLRGLDLSTQEEWAASVPGRTLLLVCGVLGGRRTAVVQLPLDAALLWLERVLGGAADSAGVPERDLTDLERDVLGHVLADVQVDLSAGLADVAPLGADLRALLTSPQQLPPPAGTPTVLAASLQLDVDGRAVPVGVMLPAEELLLAVRQRQEADARAADETGAHRAQRDRLDRAVQQAPVDVVVRSRPATVHPRDFVGLTVGDLLPLHQGSSEPLEVVVGDRVLAHAAAGTSGTRLAGLIVDVKERT